MRRNVASQYIGAQMITAADGTAFTGSVTVYVTGDAGTQAVGSVGSGACTHEGNGFHSYAPAQAETNYTHVAFTFTGTGAIPTTVQVYTTAYDASGRVDVGAVGGTSQTAGDLAALITTVDGVVDTILVDTNELQGDWTNGGRLDLIIDDILADTAVIGAAGAGLTEAGGTGDHLTAIPWNAAWDAEVQSECNDALVANNLDHLLLSAVDTNFATTVHLDSVIGHLADAGGTATFDRTTDALEILGAATAPTAAAIADAVWDEAISGHLSAGTTGLALNNASSAGDPWSTALPGAYGAGTAGNIVGNYLTGDIYARLGAPAGASIAADIATVDTVVDAILVDTAVIGAAGAGLSAIPWNASWDAEVQSEAEDALIAHNLDHLVKSAVDTNFATTVHLDSVIGHLADVGTTATFDRTTDSLEAISGLVVTVDTVVDGIKTVTDALPDSGALTSIATAAALTTVDTVVDAIKVKTDQMVFTTANQLDCTTITMATGSVSAAALAADAGNEIADAILDRNMATGTDSGSTTVRTPRQAFRLLRNKTAIAAGTLTVNKEDDATASWTAAVATSASDPISSIDPAGP